MRRIFVLRRTHSFADLAEALAQTPLDLARVVSCTFPGRPEPRSALWTTAQGVEVLRYEYLPDIEVRFLHVLTPDYSFFADGGPDEPVGPFFEAAVGGPVFEEWGQLRADLLAGVHIDAVRAAAAFRVATQAGDDSVDGAAELMNAIERGAARGPTAAAQALVPVMRREFEQRVRDASETATELEVRLHLRRALDRVLTML